MLEYGASSFILFLPVNTPEFIFLLSFLLSQQYGRDSLYKPPAKHVQEFLQGLHLPTELLGTGAGTFSISLGRRVNVVLTYN